MAFDFLAIGNVNGFYSDHFLDALFESDKEVKEVYARWDDLGADGAGRENPPKRLMKLGAEYFRTKGEATRIGNSVERLRETRNLNRSIAQALGYETRSEFGVTVTVPTGTAAIPALAQVDRDGEPYLFILEGAFAGEDQVSLLNRAMPTLNTGLSAAEAQSYRGTYEEALGFIFRRDLPPRWVLILAGNEAILAERHKWGQGKWLRFDLDRMFDRRHDVARQVAALLSRETLCPDSQSVLHDGLDDRSHRHAFGVSEDLKDGLREAVEILANEYLYDCDQRLSGAKKSLDMERPELDAQALKEECLRYLYRLLFLFYAEARGGELEIIPMNSEEYRLGYSLEHLRDLEQVRLDTPDAQNGFFLHDSLRQLYKLVNLGTVGGYAGQDGQFEMAETIVIRGLRAPLFDEEKSTPNLAKARFRNIALQRVLALLSLSKEGAGKRDRGRISYAQLGINQLGAVYEGILSYSGFFAKEDLYEVREPNKPDAPIFFVPASETGNYRENEFVNEPDPNHPPMPGQPARLRRKMHRKGSYVFQLAGRDRQKSASYYTPEVLTQCVVERALKERLNPREREPLTADEILDLTILEPAMGSGAFLNEAINQLAEHYLARKQRERGEAIPTQQVQEERQKVKSYLAANQVYGVDLNPIAVELARVSLWLNALYKDSATPWFGLRLAVGNSLIGCRRAVWKRADVANGDYRKIPPTPLPMGPEWTPLPPGGIYHFLLPDPGMVEVTDDVVKELCPKETEQVKEWRKEFVGSNWERQKLDRLVSLSQQIDSLWQEVVKERRVAAKRCEFPRNVWGQPATDAAAILPEDQERVAAELAEPFHAGPRLKLLMDYWCAFWFWPIENAKALPISDAWLLDVETILQGTMPKVPAARLLDLESEGVDTPAERDFVSQYGFIDTTKMIREVARFGIAAQAGDTHRFHHWELRFAELFADRGGFDLLLGNPPWVKLQWEEAGILSEAEPRFALRKLSATEVGRARKDALKKPKIEAGYVREWQALVGAANLFNSIQQYPLLKGGQTNLYKLFIERGWTLVSRNGVSGLLHPEGIYDDPKGGLFRRELYRRVRFHAQFINELALFEGVGNLADFGVNICGPTGDVAFTNLSNLYHPRTILESENHDGFGPVPGMKTDENEWETRGHRNRIITITDRELEVFGRLLDGENADSSRARLPIIHSLELVSVLEKLANQSSRLGDIRDKYFPSVCWDETNNCKDGTIRRETRIPASVNEWIVSGPHFHVGTPLNKAPNEGCSSHRDYTSIDLTAIGPDYLPRTNYVPAVSRAEYEHRMPQWRGKRYDEYYRLAFRNMLSITGERSLISVIIPPGVAHIHGVKGLAFDDEALLCLIAGLSFGLCTDFLIRSTGKANLLDLTGLLPVLIQESSLAQPILERTLKLVCLTKPYANLFERIASFSGLDPKWSPDIALRTDRDRRQALVELDALGAIHLGITCEELVTVYRSSFPVLKYTYERPNRYDVMGRLVPGAVLKKAKELGVDTTKPMPPTPITDLFGNPDPVEPSKGRRTNRKRAGTDEGEPVPEPTWVAIEDPRPGQGRQQIGALAWEDPKMEPRRIRHYIPPFVGFDREEDMRTAYEKFRPLMDVKKVEAV
jgi:hypothetical protein